MCNVFINVCNVFQSMYKVETLHCNVFTSIVGVVKSIVRVVKNVYKVFTSIVRIVQNDPLAAKKKNSLTKS